MGLGVAVDAFMDWSVRQPMWVGLPALIGAATAMVGVGCAVVATPFVLRSMYNEKAAKRLYADLDSRPTVIFNAAARDTKEMDLQSRAIAREKAMELSAKLGLTVSYSDEAKCAANHKDYKTEVSRHTSFIMVGKVMVPNSYTTTSYTPPIVGWQAAKDDPTLAAPLYSGPKANTAVRQDGKVFALN